MIITRTPLRISLIGGGTDMPEFYKRNNGAVVSLCINKFIYIAVNPKYDGTFRVSYSTTENVESASDIKHDIVRNVIRVFDLKGIEVVSVSDVPGNGTGLGSSSAFTVGLIRAVNEIIGIRHSAKNLAEQAYHIERKLCGHPVGKQDHYAASHGGMHFFEFSKDSVRVHDFRLLDEEWAMIADKIMLFDTGSARASDDILLNQAERFGEHKGTVNEGTYLTELARGVRDAINDRRFEYIGRAMKAGWTLKKRLADGISTPFIDELIKKALSSGAEGAKICGAGGGGFLLVIADPRHHEQIHERLGLKRVPVKVGVQGSTVIYKGE